MIAEINERISVPANGGAMLVSHASPIPENGHSPFRPFQIVSLADVNKVLPFVMFGVVNNLRKAESRLAGVQPSNTPITQEYEKELKMLIGLITEEFANPLDLPFDGHLGKRVARLLARVTGHVNDEGGCTYGAVWGDTRAVRESLESTLEEHIFLCIPDQYGAFYDQAALFGAMVAERFPQANKEITMAGNCYAMGMYTACVFHLTRAVEIMARVMVEKLGVTKEIVNQSKKQIPVKLATWDQLRTAIDKGVQLKQFGISTSEKRRETYEFYSHAVSQFASFKDAWRNKVAHKRKTYKAGETKDIMDNVKQFMIHVSQRLSEPKGATFE